MVNKNKNLKSQRSVRGSDHRSQHATLMSNSLSTTDCVVLVQLGVSLLGVLTVGPLIPVHILFSLNSVLAVVVMLLAADLAGTLGGYDSLSHISQFSHKIRSVLGDLEGSGTGNKLLQHISTVGSGWTFINEKVRIWLCRKPTARSHFGHLVWCLTFYMLSSFSDGITLATIILLVIWSTMAVPVFSKQFPETSSIIIGGSIRLKDIMASASRYLHLRKQQDITDDNTASKDGGDFQEASDNSNGTATGRRVLSGGVSQKPALKEVEEESGFVIVTGKEQNVPTRARSKGSGRSGPAPRVRVEDEHGVIGPPDPDAEVRRRPRETLRLQRQRGWSFLHDDTDNTSTTVPRARVLLGALYASLAEHGTSGTYSGSKWWWLSVVGSPTLYTCGVHALHSV
eukprot:m.399835 g.399835  ORF g.399835 m.399835 type:complete len:398 (+) comp21156_c0_seq5:239-1432(+)